MITDKSLAIAHVRKYDQQKQTLLEHLLQAAKLASAIAAKIGCPNVGKLLGLLHDFGKYSEVFQNYLLSAAGLADPDSDDFYVDARALKGKIDHSTAGAQHVWMQLAGQGPSERLAAQLLALCLASHHSGLLDVIAPTGNDIFTQRMEKPDNKTHLQEVLRQANPELLVQIRELLPLATQEINAATQRLQGQKQSGEVTSFQRGLLLRFLFSGLIDADRIDSADFENPEQAQHRRQGEQVDWQPMIADLERHLADLPPRHSIDQVRQQISQHCLDGAARTKGCYTLSVPTGGGKTLASLRFALHHAHKHGLDRIIYVVPFTTILDQNAKVARDILEADSSLKIVLEHHSNLLPEMQTWQQKLLSENWDAPIVFTTSVQFLNALFAKGTQSARRMHQLAKAVIIFDEIQALPIKTLHLFNNAINFLVEHGGSTAVMCTATQPLLHKLDSQKGSLRLAADAELMPNSQELFGKLQRVKVQYHKKPGGWELQEIADLALKEVQRIGSCLVVVNTKSAAENLFQQCQGEHAPRLFHLSTHQCPAHRKQLLAEITSLLGKQPLLCISTQLIEAGVDVDFGSVIRCTAGLESIAQAAGRCNRNGKLEMGQVHVVDLRDEKLSELEDIRFGKETAKRILQEYSDNPDLFDHDPIGPKAMTKYYEYAFFHPTRESLMVYPTKKEEIGRDDDNLLNLLSRNTFSVDIYAKKNKNAGPALFLRQSFQSAANIFKVIEAPTEAVLVPYGDGCKLIEELRQTNDAAIKKQLLRQAQQYSVNIFPYEKDNLLSLNALNEIIEDQSLFALSPRFYSKETGLSLEPIQPMEVLIAGT